MHINPPAQQRVKGKRTGKGATMNRDQYNALLKAVKENPANLAIFRKKFKNVYPFSDSIFKILMCKNPARLVVFINAIMGLEGDERIKEFHLDMQEIPGVLNNKTTIFDIVGTNERGEPVLVEVQQTDSDFFMDRLLYYTSRVITNNVKKSEEYELPHIYVLSVLTCIQFANEPDTYFHHVHLVKNSTPYYPKLDFFFVEVEKFFRIDAKLSEHKREQGKRAEMLRFFRKIINEDDTPNEKFDGDFYKRLEKDVSLEVYEDELFLREVDGMTDLLYERQTAFRKGEISGASEKARKMAKAMRDYGDSVEKICAVSGLTKEEVLAL